MHQQRLELQIPLRYDYGDWVRHAGAEEACNRLALWLVNGGRLWLTSDAIAGKTHLLHALAHEHPQLGLASVSFDDQQHPLRKVQQWVEMLEPKAFWAIDMEPGMPGRSTALALFHFFERARSMHRPLLIAWRCQNDFVLPELNSRMRGMEQVMLEPPRSDDDLRAVMRSVVDGMQWEIRDSVLDVLLTSLPRRLDALVPVLRKLEGLSLEQRQRISQTWTRQQIRQWLDEQKKST